MKDYSSNNQTGDDMKNTLSLILVALIMAYVIAGLI